jgi:AraC-like DNA-binding protein
MKSRPPALAPLLLLLFLFIQCVLYSLPPPEHLTARQLLENLEKKEFKGAVMDLNFDNVDPNHIFQRFESISGLDFVVDPKIEGVRKFTFKGIEWDKALHMVLLNLELDLELDNGVLRVRKSQPRSSRISMFLLIGVLSSILLVLLVLAFMYGVKKRAKAKQLDNKYPLPEDRVEEIKKSLAYLFEVEKIYRDPILSFNVLADRLSVPSHQLSWIINNKMGKTFSNLINHYRIEEVKKRLADSKDQKRSILEIAYSAGFNTKSSFNKTFKTLTGKTPRYYRSRNCSRAT